MWLFTLNLFFCLITNVYADSTWGEWNEAKIRYDQHEYSEALQALLNHPKDNSAYHYNLGNIYFRLGKGGAALAHLEKANRMHPHEPDIQYNLTLVRSSLSKLNSSQTLDSASNWVEQMADRLSLDEIRTALGLLGWGVALLWVRAYLKTRTVRRAFLRPSGLFPFLGFLIFAGVYGIQRWGNSCPPAISLQQQSIRSGPGEDYLELATAYEGSKVRILGTSSEESASSASTPQIWRQVRYSQDGVGWIKDDYLLML